MRFAYDPVTVYAAKVIGLEGYGLEVGCKRGLRGLQARDPIEAIRLKATRLAVIRRGRLVAKCGPRLTKLTLPGRLNAVDP
jgi:cytosine/creatinine deaminase